MNSRTTFVASLLTVISFAFLLAAPAVPYQQSITIPDAFQPGAIQYCNSLVGLGNSTNLILNESQTKIFNNCINSRFAPPTNLTGWASLSYSLFGVGTPPFPDHVFITEGDSSALVYFSGEKAVSAEKFFTTNITYNPQGVVEILNASLERSGWGVPFFSAAVKNIGNNAIQVGVVVAGIDLLGFNSYNQVINGIDWSFALANGNCSPSLEPGGVCTVQASTTEPATSQNVTYRVDVEGMVGGSYFAYSRWFDQAFPPAGLTDRWVAQFIGRVNQARGAESPLTESAALDSFAMQRFRTASSRPQISDYGLSADLGSYLGNSTNTHVEELLLFPTGEPPFAYASSLQNVFPLHWAALSSAMYAQFGYYIGRAQYYQIPADCPVKEIPSAGINVTQFFEGYGCSTTLREADWLVVVLAS